MFCKLCFYIILLSMKNLMLSDRRKLWKLTYILIGVPLPI